MQEREEQQKEQQPHQPEQQQQQRQPQMQMPTYPMQPSPYGLRQQQQQMPPYPMDPNQQYAMPYMMPPPGTPMGGMPPMVAPPMNIAPPQQQQQNVPAARPPSSGRRTPPPGPGQRSTIPAATKTRQHDTAKRKAQLHHSLPPSGLRGRASSTDSIEAPPPPPRPQRRDGALPPPPPPPPPMNQYHIRADSSGSISSIGSAGESRGQSGMVTLTDRLGNEIAGYLQEETPTAAMGREQQSQQANDGFFGFLSLSPRSQQQQSGVSVEEFHRRNQQFLQSSEQERARMQKAIRDNSPRRQYVTSMNVSCC